jgi:DNA-binding PadR family transcriptional regulator
MPRNSDPDKVPRISSKEMNVIRQLIGQEKYGLELVADSDGELARNSIYVVLGRMEDKGLIDGKTSPTPAGEMGPPRRKYKVTGHGRRVLAAHEAMMMAFARGRS